MKRATVVLVALTLGTLAYAGVAAGTGTSESQRGIRFMVGNHCNIVFRFMGFAPGTPGRLQVMTKDKTATRNFQVQSQSWTWNVSIHQLFSGPHTDETVSFRIAVKGMPHVITGTVTVHCHCGEEEGGGGGGGGNNGGGNNGNGGVSTAGAASAVTSQPGFAG